MGITKRWTAPIYASAITATLVNRRLGLPSHLLLPLPMDTPVEVQGATVTLIDANHCPGAVMFLFRLSSGRTILHVGDFRYTPSMAAHPAIAPSLPINTLYLDTTYLDPKYTFPTQAAVVSSVVSQCRLLEASARTLVLFGSYSIGKERIFMEVGRALNVRILVERAKFRLLDCMHLPPADAAILTTDPTLTRFRVVPMAYLRADRLHGILKSHAGRFDAIVAFRPTGWSFGRGAGPAGRTIKHGPAIRVVEVPYSEHSSYEELRQCVAQLRPARIVDTVPSRDGEARLRILQQEAGC